MAIADEVHKWRGRVLWDVIETGMGARRQPIIWAITTAGEEGEEDVYGQEARITPMQVLEGLVEDDGRFGYIACLDAGDDWTDPRHFIKANPNLGVSVHSAEIQDAVTKAKASPKPPPMPSSGCGSGIRTQDSDAWLPLPAWDAGKAEIDWSQFLGAPCGAGLDLASSCDFAAFSRCYPIDADMSPAAEWDRPWGYLFRWSLWLPTGYQLRTTREEAPGPGAAVGRRGLGEADGGRRHRSRRDRGGHQGRGRQECEIQARSWPTTLTMRHNWPFTSQDGHALPVEQFVQRLSTFAEPCKIFGEQVLGQRIRHDGNPCARWMANNVVLITNAAGHGMPSRKKSRNKIDGIVASVMGLGACISIPVESGINSPLVM